jgi:hypothetical protein
MEQYHRVSIYHQQDDWLQWLAMAEFAANNEISETTKETQFIAIQGMDLQMSFAGEPTKERHY